MFGYNSLMGSEFNGLSSMKVMTEEDYVNQTEYILLKNKATLDDASW